ncbi:hypothetical protein I6A84_19145 [Frankia sp. CNm7]|uniref:Uncharacterized protein n=1 Tax=Frankia nepalensis TaxID=1836974 RepID=A0A937RVJ1_9ACTN|nr:hypothetical protein [Frankia nepalensis]MBL7502379.1 hypothetical protein [Frankia nepalensis]MBL7511616.1 hypothetical protein [Frankia nepalensis]MBL7520147.1 hypothetical protein [Frankia nepalensis]MBL7633608.1 hypothetical protein [Frankia nepalensis]
MDAVRRGYLGLMLFIAALVLMPLLVVDYHRQTEDKADAAADTRAELTARPATDGGAPLSTSSPAAALPRILGFINVDDGQVLRGTVRITLATIGDIGPITYTLTGHAGQWPAITVPYLFSPHDGGWDTTAISNGVYTLTATPANTRISPRSVSFQIYN